MNYIIWTFGCQMNESDSQRIAKILENHSYKPVRKNEEADLIIVNACSVRQSAIDRVFGRARNFKKLKIQNSKLKIILTGCVLDQDKKKMGNIFDHIIDTYEIGQLPNLLKPKTKIDKNLKDYFHIEPKYNSNLEAYVPIMTGCDNFCSYCVVPYTRGQEISRPMNEIIDEIKMLVKNGCKKITLLGQNVNSYTTQKNTNKQLKNTNKDFIKLLEKVDSVSGDFWFTFLTNHPKDMSDELIKTLPNLQKLSHYIHLPFQAGNNIILKKMNRHYTKSQYLFLVKKIRKALPDVNLSTDIIVGFPEETKKQFLDTADVMKKCCFDMAYIACYSPRPQTNSYKMKDSVSKNEKIKREKILNKILAKTALTNNKNDLNKIFDILVLEKSKKKENTYFARTKNLKIIEIFSKKNPIGQFAKAKVIKAGSWSLKGELI